MRLCLGVRSCTGLEWMEVVCGTKPILDKWMWFVRVMGRAAGGADLALGRFVHGGQERGRAVALVRGTAGSVRPRTKGPEKTNSGGMECTVPGGFTEGSQSVVSGFSLFGLCGTVGGVGSFSFVRFCALCAGKVCGLGRLDRNVDEAWSKTPDHGFRDFPVPGFGGACGELVRTVKFGGK